MNTYEKMLNNYGLIAEAKVGVNETGEKVVVSIDEESACVRTLQDNGWMRINIYHKDGTEEEMFQK